MVKLLLEKGANIEARGNGTASEGRVWDSGQNPLPSLFAGDTALILAIINQRTEVVKLLLEKGANVKAADKDGRTPLNWALQEKNAEVLKLLKHHGAR